MTHIIRILLAAFLLGVVSCNTQKENKPEVPRSNIQAKPESAQPYNSVDQSPMDMSYFPADYPVLKMNGTADLLPVARVIYSRPQKKDRQIFGDSLPSLVVYGTEWRLGANEASEIEFFQDVAIQGKSVLKGRYVIYCIPHPKTWTIILNSNLYTWGLHMEPSKDMYQFDIPVQVQQPAAEYFSMQFEKTDNGMDLQLAWDQVKASLPIHLTQ